MAYQRKTVVPNVRLSDGGLRMFEGLKPEEKETVFLHFMEHWDAVRVKNNSPDDIPELPKLERRMANCLEAMCQSADEGITDYWKMVDRNNKNAPRGSQPMVIQSLSTGKPINQPINQSTNEPINQPSSQPTINEIEEYCRENNLSVDARGFLETMARQAWRSKDGRPVEDWKSLLRSWGRGTPGKTVSAQQYTQRQYTEEQLLAVSDDLIEEARLLRDEETKNA
ncbi:MAG: PT domain-containing protein [Clostridia bacterium]|nr:PT domain-containing protein [Clostridia bacterium]